MNTAILISPNLFAQFVQVPALHTFLLEDSYLYSEQRFGGESRSRSAAPLRGFHYQPTSDSGHWLQVSYLPVPTETLASRPLTVWRDRSGFSSCSESGFGNRIQKGNLPKKEKKEGIFMFEELDVFFVGIKDSSVAYGDLKRNLL